MLTVTQNSTAYLTLLKGPLHICLCMCVHECMCECVLGTLTMGCMICQALTSSMHDATHQDSYSTFLTSFA